MKDELKQEVLKVFKDLIRCGDFYSSCIELDPYIKKPIDGAEFENKIKSLIKELEK